MQEKIKYDLRVIIGLYLLLHIFIHNYLIWLTMMTIGYFLHTITIFFLSLIAYHIKIVIKKCVVLDFFSLSKKVFLFYFVYKISNLIVSLKKTWNLIIFIVINRNLFWLCLYMKFNNYDICDSGFMIMVLLFDETIQDNII